MSLPSFFGPHSFARYCHSAISRCAAIALITLVALTWNSSALCGQIHEAAQEGDLEKVKALLKSHPRLVFSKANGATPLHYAAAHDHKDVAEVLLEYKADVNARDDDGLTPLFWAVEWGPSVVELLLVNHSDVNAKNNDSLTPLHEATQMGRKHLVELLVAYKADVNITDSRGLTPLHIAAAYDRTDVAEFLLANKAQVDAKANDGRTPLHVAAYKACKNVAELLLANKADINAKDKSDHTPLHYALNVWDGWDEDKPTRETRAKALVALLRQHGGHE